MYRTTNVDLAMYKVILGRKTKQNSLPITAGPQKLETPLKTNLFLRLPVTRLPLVFKLCP